jgi:hypothetical protein
VDQLPARPGQGIVLLLVRVVALLQPRPLGIDVGAAVGAEDVDADELGALRRRHRQLELRHQRRQHVDE